MVIITLYLWTSCSKHAQGQQKHRNMTNEECNTSIILVARADEALAVSDFEAFGKQCGKFIKAICGVCNDRFANVGNKEVFWSNTSLKDAGRLTFADKMGGEIIPGLHALFHKTRSNGNTVSR